MKKESFDRAKWIPILIIAIILLLIYKAIDNFTQITTAITQLLRVISPLLYGILFAYFLYTPHHALEKLYKKVMFKKITFISKRARGFSTITVFLLLLLIVSFVLAFVLPILFSSIVDLASDVPGYIFSVLAYFDNLPADSPLIGLDIPGLLRDNSGAIIYTVLNPAGIEQAARGIISFAGGIVSIIMGLVISLYILLYRSAIATFFKRLSNALIKNTKKRDRMIKYLGQINKVLFAFIAGKGLDSIINFVAATTILLVFNVPYALLLGLIAGLFNFIPYIGSIVATVIISILTLITCEFTTALTVVIFMFAFNQLDGNYIEPRIMKTALRINPILVIIAVVVGGAYLGVAGMFLAVPIAVIIKQILNEYIVSTETATEAATEVEFETETGHD